MSKDENYKKINFKKALKTKQIIIKIMRTK